MPEPKLLPIGDDVFRPQHRLLSPEEQSTIGHIKDAAAVLYDHISDLGLSREAAIAKTKLEEAVMWAVKAATA